VASAAAFFYVVWPSGITFSDDMSGMGEKKERAILLDSPLELKYQGITPPS
jgi:hypothetical protein